MSPVVACAVAAALCGGSIARSATEPSTGTTATTSPGPGGDGGRVSRSLDQPLNLAIARQNVRKYYGDTVGADGRHRASPDSAWGRSVRASVADGKRYLKSRLGKVDAPVLVLDVDDTSFQEYDWQANREFAFEQRAFHEAVRRQELPVIEPTRDLAVWAARRGVQVYFMTGREASLREATLKALNDSGFPAPDGIYFKPPKDDPPPYLDCAAECTMKEFKSGTRAHLTARGKDIVLNVGDHQVSDLEGGNAERSALLPNPMY
ncbi:HAD family acid phosphatase [Streptomyces sp. NPDC088726]|uniref:HAD family acid phosphatase n=1 Tax=Streptomyces sp. NPDC088726 TaxID=3365874 RepID=UPI0038063604